MEESKKFLNKKKLTCSSCDRPIKFVFIFLILYLYTLIKAFQEYEPIRLSDRTIESLYFKGKKVFKISYDDLEKKKNNFNKISLDGGGNPIKSELEPNNLKKTNITNEILDSEKNEENPEENNLYKAISFYSIYQDERKIKKNHEFEKKFFPKNLIFEFEKINSYDYLGKYLYNEVINDNINFYFENNIFEFNLKNQYGNKTKLKINYFDLEAVVENNVLSNNQAFKFWEELIKYNTKKFDVEFSRKNIFTLTKYLFSFTYQKFFSEKKNQYNNFYNNNPNDIYKSTDDHQNEDFSDDFYIFNFLPAKSTGCWIFAAIIFVVNYNILNIINNKERSSPTLNLLLLLFSLFMTEHFYYMKIYFTSNIFLIQFTYCLKFFISSIIILLGYIPDDYDIFAEFPKSTNTTQFILQISNLLICTGLIGIFSFFRYNYLVNYTFFYYCLLQIPYLISINFHNNIPIIFQPFRYFLILILGFVNFFIINFGKNNFYYTNSTTNPIHQEIKPDSFYVVGDLFSLFCFSYFFDYLFIQSNKISVLFQENEQGTINKEKLNEKITKIIKNYKELIREFDYDDALWLISFKIGFIFQYVGLKFHKYLIYYFSYYYFRMILGVYGRLFNIRCLRLTYSFLVLIFLITNFIMSSKTDSKLFHVKEFNFLIFIFYRR